MLLNSLLVYAVNLSSYVCSAEHTQFYCVVWMTPALMFGDPLRMMHFSVHFSGIGLLCQCRGFSKKKKEKVTNYQLCCNKMYCYPVGWCIG